MALRRIQKEERDLRGSLRLEQGRPDWAGMVASYEMQTPGDMFHWVLELDAPAAAPYVADLFYGVRLRLLVEYPSDYPFKAPRLKIDEQWLQHGCENHGQKERERTEAVAPQLPDEEELIVDEDERIVGDELLIRNLVAEEEGAVRDELFENGFVAYAEHAERQALEEEADAAYVAIRSDFSDTYPGHHVCVKMLTGKSIHIRTHMLMSVEELKVAIQDAEGIPANRQRLILAGKQLEDGRDLRDYNVLSASTVHLVLRFGCSSCFFSPLIGHDQWSPATTISKIIESMYADAGPFGGRVPSKSPRCWMTSVRRLFPPNMSDDKLQWLLRSNYPSRQQWTMATDMHWPLTFRKIVLYLLQIRGSGQRVLAQDEGAVIAIAAYL